VCVCEENEVVQQIDLDKAANDNTHHVSKSEPLMS
jgi:hypothetical protein